MNSYFNIRWSRYRRAGYIGSHQPCCLCGGKDLVIVSRFDRWFNPLVNVLCRGCGLVFLDPMPTVEEVDNYHSRQFWLQSQGSVEPTEKTITRASQGAEGRLSMLASMLKPGMRILDVGAGGGEFVAAAQRRGFDAEGVEPNIGYARYGQRTYGVKIHAMPFAQVDFGGKKFDLITSNHSLEHMRDPLGVMIRFHELLEPDGYLHIWVPDLGGPNMWPLRYFHAGHMSGFTYETLIMMGAKAGFAPIDPGLRGTLHVFRRLPAPDPNWFSFPDYPAEAETLWRRRTIWRHLIVAETYQRIPTRIASFVRQFLAVTKAPAIPKQPK